MTSDYQNYFEELFNLRRFGIKTGLEHTRKLLHEVGNPHYQLKFIHVAGTNGKGSTCAFLYNILKQMGKKVGLYTSPHLLNINERIRVNGKTISNEEIIAFMRKNQKNIKNVQSTFFETTTVMAFDYFSKQNVDIAIIETGLGGRLDSTNVITPEASIITSISMDHMDVLGKGLNQITKEKSGIIKDSVPLILLSQDEFIQSIILEKAKMKNSLVTIIHPDNAAIIRIDCEGTLFSYNENNFHISLIGKHQVLNCILAIEAAKKVCGDMSQDKINKACRSTKWPGRIEHLVNYIYYDVAHNASSISAIIETIKTIHPGKSIIGLFCLKGDKDIDYIANVIRGKFYQLLVTTDEKGLLLPMNKLCSFLSNQMVEHTPVPSIENGIAILKNAREKDRVGLIFGSHYVANEIYRMFEISFDTGDI